MVWSWHQDGLTLASETALTFIYYVHFGASQSELEGPGSSVQGKREPAFDSYVRELGKARGTLMWSHESKREVRGETEGSRCRRSAGKKNSGGLGREL